MEFLAAQQEGVGIAIVGYAVQSVALILTIFLEVYLEGRLSHRQARQIPALHDISGLWVNLDQLVLIPDVGVDVAFCVL